MSNNENINKISNNLNNEMEKQIGDYILQKEIGSGGFAKVFKGIHIPSGEKVAIKIMDKTQLMEDPLNFQRVENEISILKKVQHKNIIKLYELMESPQKIYLVMELCEGGELFDYIVNHKNLPEEQACRFFQEIINALEYLHSMNIVHRDVKPENLLLDISYKTHCLKLIDFGISTQYKPSKLLTTPCGTASYAPPEMHKGEEYYGLLSDIWSTGIVLYSMVFGFLPFSEEDEEENINKIIEGNYEIPENCCSDDFKDLIKHLLEVDPLERYDFEMIKKHKWYNLVSPPQNIPGLVVGKNKIPIDDRIINICGEYGYDKKKVLDSVKKNKYDRNSAIYYIVLKKLIKEGYTSVSDMYSEEYLEYMRDLKNLEKTNDEEKSYDVSEEEDEIKKEDSFEGEDEIDDPLKEAMKKLEENNVIKDDNLSLKSEEKRSKEVLEVLKVIKVKMKR